MKAQAKDETAHSQISNPPVDYAQPFGRFRGIGEKFQSLTPSPEALVSPEDLCRDLDAAETESRRPLTNLGKRAQVVPHAFSVANQALSAGNNESLQTRNSEIR